MIQSRIRACAALLLLGFAVAATAQAPGVKRVLLQRSDVGDNREAILGLAEIAPGAAAGRHSHPGIEMGYVLEGSGSLEVEGEAPKLLKAGDSYLIPAGRVHDAKTVGDAPTRVLATYVVEKGKPFATPAP